MAKSKRLADDGLLVEEGFEQQPREEDVPVEEQIGPPDALAEEKFLKTAYVSEDELGMKMEPAIVGPRLMDRLTRTLQPVGFFH